MAICGNCGAEGARVRSRWLEGKQLPDECPQCSPGSFERFKSVRDGQISMGWEYMPSKYRKTDNGYVPTDELIADTEAELSKACPEDEQAYQNAVEEKRAKRRTKPMTETEKEIAIARWSNIESSQSDRVN